MATIERERRLLQQVVALAAVLPVAVGLYGVLFGPALTNEQVSISGDSHFRYLSGLLLAVGVLFWSTVPRIEEKTNRFRLLALIVVLGGLARFLGLALTGLPSFFMLGGLFMELIVTPILVVWQARVANRYADTYGIADAP